MPWRIIYDNETLYGIGECSPQENIYTDKNIFIGDTLESCFKEIDELGLYTTYPSGDTQIIIFSGGTRVIQDLDDYLGGE